MEDKNNSSLDKIRSKKSLEADDDDVEMIDENKTINISNPITVPGLERNILANDDFCPIETIENTSSSSPEEITRENSLEKDDVGLSSPEDINVDKKDALIQLSSECQMNEQPNLLPPSEFVPQITTKMSVKDRMAIGKFS